LILEKEQNIAEEKLQCKFRKSCYNADGSVQEPQKKSEKTKKIKQDDNEQLLKTNPKTKEPKEERSEHEKVERDDYEQRLDCKYRKSCYQSGVLPQNLWPSSTSSNKDEIDLTAEQEELDDYAWRLKCKYRKSCYETGKLNKELLFITNEVVDETAKEQGQSIEMKCKYRKSCYETEFLIREQQDAYVDRLVQPNVPSTEKIKEHKSSQQKKTPDSRQKTDEESDKDKKKKKSKTKASTIDEPDESPYMQQTSPQEKAATKEKDSKLKIKEFSPRPSTIGCNPWHVSCRKAVGLPIKEKAPMGPNGRKLCRKKKVDHVAR